MPDPWYIAWFRSPVTVLCAAEGPAMIAAALWFVAFLFTGPICAVLWMMTHVALAAYTRRAQRRYGTRDATARESELCLSYRDRVFREWHRWQDQDTKGDQ